MGSFLTSAKGWLSRRFRNRAAEPEFVEFEAGVVIGSRREVLLAVSRAECLSAAQLRELRGAGVGCRFWWLRHERYGFARVELPRGDEPFVRWLMLPAGRYVLGVGLLRCGRRIYLAIGESERE